METHSIAVGELAKHTLSFVYGGRPMVLYGKLSAKTDGFAGGPYWNGASASTDDQLNSVGNDKYHNNIAPCIASYLWKRTA